jgi:hypothetical protein
MSQNRVEAVARARECIDDADGTIAEHRLHHLGDVSSNSVAERVFDRL